MKISAAVVTSNEASNIERCLRSLEFCDEIILVDSKSSDKTVSLARKYTKNIFLHDFTGFSGIKNYAIDKCHNYWILSVDADEEISPALKERILKITGDENSSDGYRIKRADFFLGREIKHCGWDKDYQLRLFKKSKGRFDGKTVHESIIVNGAVGKIDELIYHYSYPNSGIYFNKMNRYTTMQAQEKQKGLLVLRMFFVPFMKFFRMYFLKSGFLDGFQGFVLSIYSAFSEFIKYAKMYETIKDPGTDSILLKAPNWIGDAVMMTMLLKEIKRVYKKTYVAVTGPGVKAILEGNPYIDHIIQYDRKSAWSALKAAAQLRKENISAGVSFSPSLSSDLFLLLSGVTSSVGFDADLGGLVLKKTYRQDKSHKREHITGEYKKLMYLVNSGFDFSGAKQELYPKCVSKYKHSGKQILIAPFAKFGSSKMWPIENYIELIRLIMKRHKKVTVTITGLKDDNSFVIPGILTADKRFVDLRGGQLDELMCITKEADLFIGNDSGVMHMADAFGVPVMVIYGSTAAYWGGPINSKTEKFYAGLNCQPCFNKECRYGHYNCLKSIKPEDVYNKIGKYL